MTDPISVATIVATTTTTITKFCVEAGANLNEIRHCWKEAPEMLNCIKGECWVVRGTMRNIRDWLEQHEQEMNTDKAFLNGLSDALTHCFTTMEWLESSTKEYLLECTKKRKTWKRTRITINNDSLKNCLDNLHFGMLTAHFYSKPTNVVPDEDIFAAAVAGSLQNLSNLVKRGGRPYVRNSKNWTPSHYAAANGSIETVSSLSKYGNTNWFADDDITPVHLAARNGHTTAVKQLLKIPGHDWNRQRAVDQQASDMIKMAIGNKFARELETFFRRKTFTAQELAIIYGHVDTVLAFHVEPGSDMLHALSCACMLGNLQIVDAILYHLQNRQNYQKPESLYRQARWFPAPPLHLAVMSGNQATVALLLNQDIDSRKQAKTHRHIMQLLLVRSRFYSYLKEGVPLAALDYRSRTPLSYAVEHLNEAAVEVLVKHKHPKRRGWLFGSTVSGTYLGPGHVWLDKTQKAAAIPNPWIRKALKDVGFTLK
ncbi:MAG: hypothetical protein LQ342_006001 [Letrouitia transgressa]|nr:MAG: hypothetical protein LQ342_006001 [Letrouitia transgressa]